MISSALALHLHKDRHISEVVALPSGPRVHHLKALAVGVNRDLDVAAVVRRRDIGGVTWVKTGFRDFRRRPRRIQLDRVALGIGQGIRQRVEGKPTSQSESGGNLRAGDEVHRRRLAVVPRREVTVV